MMTRRQTVAGLTALAAVPAPSARALPVSRPYLLPPLKTLTPDHIAGLLRRFERYRLIADDLTIPEELRVLYQHMAGLRLAVLAFPLADAVARLEDITARWPRLKPNVDLAIAARIEGRSDWDWNYQRVRIDGGPPV